VTEEAVGRLGGGPVLARGGGGSADPPAPGAEDLAQAGPQTPVGGLAAPPAIHPGVPGGGPRGGASRPPAPPRGATLPRGPCADHRQLWVIERFARHIRSRST